MGLEVGDSVGARDGRGVGARDGDLVGAGVGAKVGAAVGVGVGVAVGAGVGGNGGSVGLKCGLGIRFASAASLDGLQPIHESSKASEIARATMLASIYQHTAVRSPKLPGADSMPGAVQKADGRATTSCCAPKRLHWVRIIPLS